MPDVVGEAVRPRQPNARLRGLVVHRVDAAEQRLDVAGPQVGLDQLEPFVRTRDRDVLLLRRAVVVRREAVDAEHGVAAGEQRLGEMTADEAGRAGDQRAHYDT